MGSAGLGQSLPSDQPATVLTDGDALADRALDVTRPVRMVRGPRDRIGVVAHDGMAPLPEGWRDAAMLAPVGPGDLGSSAFRQAHGARCAYVAGAMAHGIAGVELVSALAHARLLSFFGTAGLPLREVDDALDRLSHTVPQDAPWGANLLHTPGDPAGEMALVERFHARSVPCASASGFVAVAPSVVRFACRGLRRRSDAVCRPHRVVAKVSRASVAAQFAAPPPADILHDLVGAGWISADEALLAAELPLAEDIVVEADSAGHTDRQALLAVLPCVRGAVDAVTARQGFAARVRVGAAGGIGTPASLAAVFQLGADFAMVGSVHQACVESGLSQAGRELLAAARPEDVALAPSAARFERGAQVQVLRRGSLFAARARRLADWHARYPSLDAMPPEELRQLETQVLGQSVEAVWAETRSWCETYARSDLDRAMSDPHHRMALVFRWYLGRSSAWARDGHIARRRDFQIWCSPAMGAFNAWISGTYLEDPRQRRVADVAAHLCRGAAHHMRVQQLRLAGVVLPSARARYVPRRRV